MHGYTDRRGRKHRRAARPLSNTSINKTLAALATILDLALERELIPRNPAAVGGKRRRQPSETPRRSVLDPADHITALLAGAGELDRRPAGGDERPPADPRARRRARQRPAQRGRTAAVGLDAALAAAHVRVATVRARRVAALRDGADGPHHREPHARDLRPPDAPPRRRARPASGASERPRLGTAQPAPGHSGGHPIGSRRADRVEAVGS